jgi:hypothetical protein
MIARSPGTVAFSMMGLAVLVLVGMGCYPGFYYLYGLLLPFCLWCGVLLFGALRGSIASFVHHRRPWLLFFCIPIAVTLLLGFKLPLRIGFLTARSGLNQLVAASEQNNELLAQDTRVGLYTFSAAATNSRRRAGVEKSGHVVFYLSTDPESAFVYGPHGIDTLIYSPGVKGGLCGDWYWMRED